MKQATLIPSTPALDEILRADLAGRVEWVPDARVAISGASAVVDSSLDLFVRIVQGFPLGDEFLDTTVIHPIGAGGGRRVADFAFAFMARTGKRSLAVDSVFAPVARDVARDYAQILLHDLAEGYEQLLRDDPERVEVVLAADPAPAEVVSRLMRGHAPASRRGPGFSIFEGAGTPQSASLAAAMMLELLGEGMAADRILRRLRAS